MAYCPIVRGGIYNLFFISSHVSEDFISLEHGEDMGGINDGTLGGLTDGFGGGLGGGRATSLGKKSSTLDHFVSPTMHMLSSIDNEPSFI